MDEGQEKDLPAMVEENRDEIIAKIESDLVDAADNGNSDRDVLSEAVRKKYNPIITAMVDAATGLYEMRTVSVKGTEAKVQRVYQRLPDMATARYLIDQLIGKATETNINLGIQKNILVQWIKPK